MIIDIREEDDKISKIIFDDEDYIVLDDEVTFSSNKLIKIASTETGDEYILSIDCIDNLIKALKKAKEVWS